MYIFSFDSTKFLAGDGIRATTRLHLLETGVFERCKAKRSPRRSVYGCHHTSLPVMRQAWSPEPSPCHHRGARLCYTRSLVVWATLREEA
jgi:hypothetical protein